MDYHNHALVFSQEKKIQQKILTSSPRPPP
uniref:Uncharacterized protein n=1 Tax=Anguilla anguilla TaxID=7936 RepID=A0A0E9RSM2_ANGAN